jgi:hypothetical protein
MASSRIWDTVCSTVTGAFATVMGILAASRTATEPIIPLAPVVSEVVPPTHVVALYPAIVTWSPSHSDHSSNPAHIHSVPFLTNIPRTPMFARTLHQLCTRFLPPLTEFDQVAVFLTGGVQSATGTFVVNGPPLHEETMSVLFDFIEGGSRFITPGVGSYALGPSWWVDPHTKILWITGVGLDLEMIDLPSDHPFDHPHVIIGFPMEASYLPSLPLAGVFREILTRIRNREAATFLSTPLSPEGQEIRRRFQAPFNSIVGSGSSDGLSQAYRNKPLMKIWTRREFGTEEDRTWRVQHVV